VLVPVLGTIGILLAFLILLRALHGRMLAGYPCFYCYIAMLLLGTAIAASVRVAFPAKFSQYYWPIQLVTLVFGYGIVLEIFRHVLFSYPGVGRFARVLGLVSLAATLCFALVYPLIAPPSSHIGPYGELERGVRALQAILLVGILAVISHYGIPLGRNMKGMILGYGLYVGTSLVSLAVEAYAGVWLVAVWGFAQPVSLLISLLIWLVALWSYAPNPAPSFDTHLEQDYEALVVRTKMAIGALRSYLFKTVRS